MTTSLIARARFGVALMTVLGLAGGVYGCDSNAWSDLPTGGGSSTRDETEPVVAIVAPDSTGRVAVGDSVLIRVDVSDDAGIDSVRLSGFALRGSAELGTQTRVERFVTKTVDLSRLVDAVRDTTVARYLLATSDSLAEDVVYLTATARDVAGNLHADTVAISIGGPRLEVITPTEGSTVRAGTELSVRLIAADSIGRIESLGVQLVGEDLEVLQELELDPPAARVDTTLTVDVPVDATGQLELRAFAHTMTNDLSTSTPLLLEVSAAGGDHAAPQVSFSVADVGRKEMDDSVTVTVTAKDSTQVERLGATIKASLRFHSSTQVLPVHVEEAGGDSAQFRIALSDLGAVEPADTSYVLRLEVTAFAVDTAGNCATATVPGTPLSQLCSPAAPAEGTEVASAGPGSRVDMVIVRGATTRVSVPTDRLVDLVADSARRRVYVSNLSRNRVEVLGFGADAFGAPVNVGSEPWGLAIGRSRDTMFVANSGGTNISIVPLTSGALQETARIHTSNIRLYSFTYDVKSDSVSAMSEHDYSDRPQFLGQVASGQLLYSTKPTTASSDGTIRIFDATKDTTRAYNRGSEVVTQYARDGKAVGKGVVVNALEVDYSDGMLVVWPRRLLRTGTDPDPIVATPTVLEDSLAVLRAAGLTDTRIDVYVDVADVGLTDTTFVAVSRNHGAIAFGEGAVNPGRVLLFQNQGGGLVGSTTNTDDLVGNAAERVVGLSLNGDGSLGIARGSQSYFFDRNLRLQGVVASGQPSGGVVLHPLNTGYPSGSNRVGFVSGVDASGRAYVDVVDSYSFRRIRRIPIREPITGTMTAVAVGAGDPAYGTYVLRLFGITAGGVVEIGLTAGDLD